MKGRSANKAVLARMKDHIIPLFTPFDSTLELDRAALTHNVARTIELPGCGGIYIGSVYQEFWALTTSERQQIAELVIETVNGRIPVVVGVSSASMKTTLRLAEAARDCGADMLMVWPPTFGPRDNAGVLRFYETVTSNIDVPTCVYSTTLPELGFYLDDGMLHRLAEMPTICAVKEASFSLTRYLQLLVTLGDRLAISTPFDEYWMIAKLAFPDETPDFLMGSSRALYMQSARRPYLQEILKLVRANRTREAYAIFAKLGTSIAELQMASFDRGSHPIAMVKYAAHRLGMVGTSVRPPTPELTLQEKQKVDEMLERLSLLDDPPK